MKCAPPYLYICDYGSCEASTTAHPPYKESGWSVQLAYDIEIHMCPEHTQAIEEAGEPE